MDSLACPKEKKNNLGVDPALFMAPAQSSETHLRRFQFSSPPVGINPVLSNVGAFPRTVYKAWFYYFPPLDM